MNLRTMRNPQMPGKRGSARFIALLLQPRRAYLGALTVALVTFGWLSFSKHSGSNAALALGNQAYHIDQLLADYSLITSVHLRAKSRIEIRERVGAINAVTTPISGEAVTEYWADRDMYRLRCFADPRLGISDDVDVAYDGHNFSMLDVNAKTISFQAQPVAFLPTALPNPLFFPIAFLNNEPTDKTLFLQDIVGRLADFQDRMADSWAVSPKTFDQGFEVPGEDGYNWRVYLQDFQSRLVPKRIEQVTYDGRTISRQTLEYRVVEILPGSVRSPVATGSTSELLNYESDGRVLIRIQTNLDVLEINDPVPPSVFSVSFDSAEAVWDNDARIFVKDVRVPEVEEEVQ